MSPRRVPLSLPWLLLLLGLAARSSRAVVSNYYPTIQSGLDLIERGAYAAAVDTFIKAQRLDPEDPLAHLGLGTASLYLRDGRAAVSELRAALRLDPQSSAAYNGLGLCALAQNSTNDALVNFGNATRCDPSFADAYVNLAYAYCLEKRPDVALDQCIEAQRHGVEGPFFLEVQGMAHTLSASCDNAILALRKVLSQQKAVDRTQGLVLSVEMLSSLAASSSAGLGSSAILERVVSLGGAGYQPAVLSESSRSGGALLRPSLGGISVTDRAGGEVVSGRTRLVASVPTANASEGGAAPGGQSIRFVSFAVDGYTRSVVNTPPYKWDWDTFEDPEGEHVVTIRAYDKGGSFVGEQRLRVRVMNGRQGSPLSPPRRYTEKQEQSFTARIKKLLKLQADPLHARYLLAKAYESKGTDDLALREYTNVFLNQNDYLDSLDLIHTLRKRFPVYSLEGRVGEIDGVAGAGKKVAITFDDGPRYPYTTRILDLLKTYEARGTFFVVGKMARLNPDLVRLISASGHELAGHSYSHRHMTDLTETEVEDEILRTEVAVREIVDQQIHYFRPPGGHYDARVKRAVENLGYRAVFWGPNITSFTDLKPDETAREMLKRVTPGCILLLHNGEDQTLPVLPKLLAGLKKSGFEMVTLTELLSSGKPIKRKLKWE